MRDKDVIQHIQDLCKERSWTYYRLAKEADIPYSTLNNMVNRTNPKQRRNFFSVDKLFLNFSKARDFSRISL